MPGLTYTQPLTTQAIQLIQQRLQQQGAYNGRADGIWGPDSQSALERFQGAHGLQVTGQINQATAATLGLPTDQLLAAGQVPAPAVAATEQPVAGANLSRNAVRSVQARLRELNYYHGPVDGVWGGSTQQAVERFQQGRALQVNGQLNPTTISALGLAPDVFAR
ncbi:MAG: peptidoglycan-binding protein [Acetobacteraceae bacterium]|nr:peptidoglycan-binding protein [Acetobacteraceae bacterium]